MLQYAAMKNYIRLIKYTRPHMKVLSFAFVFMILSEVFQPISLGVLIPFISRVFMGQQIQFPNRDLPPFFYVIEDKLNSITQLELLPSFLIFFLILFVLRTIFMYFRQYLARELSQRVVRDIRDKVYDKLLGLSMKFYSHSKTGTLVSRITFDSTIVQDAVSEGLRDIVSQGALFMFSLGMLITVAWIYKIPAALVLASLFLPPLIIAPVVQIGKKLKKISKRTQESMADINNALYETMSGIRIVKAFSMESYEHDRFKTKSLLYKKTTMKSNKRILAISPLTELIGAICCLLVIWILGRDVIADKFEFAVLFPFIFCILSLVRPLNRLGRVHSINQKALAAAERIFELLDTEKDIIEKPNAMTIKEVRKTIEFKDVNFSYDGKIALANINLVASAGDIVAFVGPSGAGKTTLVNLIPRFYDPDNGYIAINGIDIKDLTLKSLRKQIGIVTQDTILFNDTVLNNISYGNKDIDMKKVTAAARAANAHDFITKMPEGYNTTIGERGFRISGGEKQRLAIARAILKNPPMLIFDEATSQLDSQSEILVQDAIDRLMSGRTVFVIAHRLSTIKHASKIVVMDKGKIADIGTHDELLSREGLYKSLYNMQFRNL